MCGQVPRSKDLKVTSFFERLSNMSDLGEIIDRNVSHKVAEKVINYPIKNRKSIFFQVSRHTKQKKNCPEISPLLYVTLLHSHLQPYNVSRLPTYAWLPCTSTGRCLNAGVIVVNVHV